MRPTEYQIKRVSDAMAQKRAELINMPLARVWDALARVAIDTLGDHFEADGEPTCPFSSSTFDLPVDEPCPVCGALGNNFEDSSEKCVG